MQIKKFLMEVHVVFNALKRNDPQDRIRDVTNECLVCHVRVDVQLVTMRVEVDTVFETLSIVVDVTLEQIWVDSKSFRLCGGKQESDIGPSIDFDFRPFIVIVVNGINGSVTLSQSFFQ